MYRCCAGCSGSIAVLILEVGIFVLTGLWCRSRRWSVLCGFLLALAFLFFFLHFGCGGLLFGLFFFFGFCFGFRLSFRLVLIVLKFCLGGFSAFFGCCYFFFVFFSCGLGLLLGCFLEFLCFCFLVCPEVGSASPDEFVVFYRSAVKRPCVDWRY